VDWCQRAKRSGYPNVLALGSFVFHEGSGTNRDEGLLAHGMSTVPAHEMIIRQRYPEYMDDVLAFLDTEVVDRAAQTSTRDALFAMLKHRAYTLVVTNGRTASSSAGAFLLAPTPSSGLGMMAVIDGVAAPQLSDGFSGFDEVVERFGCPTEVVILEPGEFGAKAAQWASALGCPVTDQACYPTAI
jgi:hypothetical protein